MLIHIEELLKRVASSKMESNRRGRKGMLGKLLEIAPPTQLKNKMQNHSHK